MNFNQDKQLDVSVRFRHSDVADTSSHSVEIQSFWYQNQHHAIRSVQNMFRDEVGQHAFVHFQVETDRDLVFNVVFDTEAFAWYMIGETDAVAL